MARHFRIHPAIGVVRMGNSTEHFIGPETPGLPANSDDGVTFKSFRDAQGRILRQGARFRVFEYTEDETGALSNPRELVVGGDIADIEWRVHVANRKASFFVFYGQFGADDLYQKRIALPPSEQVKNDPPRTNLRNASIVSEAERTDKLEIDPGERLISQAQPSPVELVNNKPHIPIKSLGTLLVDSSGRLTVLGGYGDSRSIEDPPPKIDDYASNDTWFDDAGDGSVKARIRLRDGTVIDADPAWVCVGPPDFAPGIGNVVSLMDTLWDTAVREVDLAPSTPATPLLQLLREQKKAWQAGGGKNLTGFKPSFTRDIFPLVKRALGARSVHVSGTANQNYHRKLLTDWALMSTLGGPRADEAARLRRGILFWIRDPDDTQVKWDKMPRGLGDDYTSLDAGTPTPRSFLSLTRIQYALLREWAAGNFIDDWPGSEPVPSPNPSPSPDDLDFAAAENSVGGPFYPGIEVSWLIRVKELFAEPFRLKVPREPEDGASQTSPLVVGALKFRSGFFSQQMALPWQADFYDCHRERFEDPDGNEFFFMWWTAQRPDDVFPAGKDKQEPWVRIFYDGVEDIADFEENDVRRFERMQSRWFDLKFITVKRGEHYEEES